MCVHFSVSFCNVVRCVSLFFISDSRSIGKKYRCQKCYTRIKELKNKLTKKHKIMAVFM